jgi:hypothetical protein
MRTSGLVSVTIGSADDASPVDYEILDPESCQVLGQVLVGFVTDKVSEVVVGPTGAVESRVLDSSIPGLEHLEVTDLCPMPGS